MRYVILLLLQFFLNYNTLAKETASDKPLSVYLDSLKKLRRDYQITGYNLYRFLGKNSPVRSQAKKKIDWYFGINAELLNTLDFIINKKEYPSLYLAAEKPLVSSDFWEGSQGNSDDGERPSGESGEEAGVSENQNSDGLPAQEFAGGTAISVPENSAVPNQQNAATNANGIQGPENSEEDNEEDKEDDGDEDDNEAEENQQQPAAAVNPQTIAAGNYQPAVGASPQPITVASQQPAAAANPQISDALTNQYPTDVINPQTGMNQMLPSLDENFQQYQGDVFTPTNDYPGQPNVEQAGFISDDVNGNGGDVLIQNNGNKDKLGNFLMKAQLAKNAFVGDVDKYGNAYEDEYDGQSGQYQFNQYQNNSNRGQAKIDSASMDSDRLNYQSSDFVNEDQIFDGNQAGNRPSQDDSAEHTDDSNDFNGEEDEAQQAVANNVSQISDDRSAENPHTQEEDEDNNADEDSGSDVGANSSENSENNAGNDADEDSGHDESDGTDEDDGDEGYAASPRISQIARQQQMQSSVRQPPARQPARQSANQSARQFAPQSGIPQQNPNFPYNAYQYGYGANFGTYNGAMLNSAANSRNIGVSAADTRKQSVSYYEGDSGTRAILSQPTDPKISNYHDINKFLNSDHGEITVDRTSFEPRYLNEFDRFVDSYPQDSGTSGENKVPVVQVPKNPDEASILMVPDSSDGKLHINHF